MAVGDVVIYQGNISNNSYLDLQPSSGQEVVVHNVYYAGKIEVYHYDGSNEFLITRDDVAGCILGLCIHCNNTYRIRIKNVSGSTMYIRADGVETKAA